MSGMLRCVEYELSKTLSGLPRQAQAHLTARLQRALEIFASLKPLIEEAEVGQLYDIRVWQWRGRIVEICYEMMCVLDKLNLQEVGRVRVFSHEFFFLNPFPRHEKGIYEIISGFEKLEKEATQLPILPVILENWEVSSEQLQLDHLLHSPDRYERDEKKDNVVSKLFVNQEEEEDIRFISIVGAAGIGKTALAQLVCNDAQVKDYFDYRARVFVSEELNLRKIVMAILGLSTSDVRKDVEMELLVLMFRRVTAGKRCLFFLDEVANEDAERWQLMKEFFSNFCVAGSRILITTRHNSVAALASAPEDIIRLRRLSDEESWEVFRSSAFGPSTNADSWKLELCRDITKKCRGEPLYLRSVGGIIRHIRSSDSTSLLQLLTILERQTWEGAQEIQVGPLLMFLHFQFPRYWKQCLFYCSIFPKDHVIVIDQLIQLWIAQGFVISDDHDDNHVEEQGRRIFIALSGYPIFKHNTIAATPGSTCLLESRISDLLHAMAKNEYSTMLLESGEKFREDGDVPIYCRHCTLTIATHTCLPKSIPNAEKLHTLMILSQYSSVDATNLSSLLSNLSKVRALILSSCSIQELPTRVGKLFHLRYLDLSFNPDLKRLPGAICNLLYLQTLNLNGCHSLRKLPKGIGKLIKLRHLEILWTTSLTYLPKGIACLTSLRTLSRFIGNSLVGSKSCNIGDLENLNNIQGNITIDGLGAETDASEAERAGLENKKGLRGLELWFTAPGAGTNDERVLGALKAPSELEDLGIFYYRGELFPAWMITLQKLTHLTLADCDKCSVLPWLAELPSLESLKIMNMPSVKKVVDSEFLGAGSTVAFPKLDKLSFENLGNWEEWVGLADDGDQANFMPMLSSLSIVNCRKLKAIPNYIKLKKNEKPGFRINIKKCPSLDQTQHE
ncbi:hypothetical protein PIB30_035676 [Stylosanthes scabra]|uniref:Uncharacterized protein n=1 Tax=Stylosanthes scabra TaxID=79078 RepID=A0ABU6TF49_9FABA|nr:hypothetical protein [Stylosanthes scabra]